MVGNFSNLPSVDHLTEGVHYRVVEFNFADAAPVPHTPGTPCPEGHKMVFGVCRKLKAGTQDIDRDAESDEEKAVRAQGLTPGKDNRPVQVGEKKYGWALLNGKPIIVEWGSVKGVKNADGSVTKVTRNADNTVSKTTEPAKPQTIPVSAPRPAGGTAPRPAGGTAPRPAGKRPFNPDEWT